MTIIPAIVQQLVKGELCQLPVLWVDGVLTRIAGEAPRENRQAASRAAWRAGRRLYAYATQDLSRAVVLRRFHAGEEERLMEGVES